MNRFRESAIFAFVAFGFLSSVGCATLTEDQKKKMVKEAVVETKMDKNAIYSSANSMLAQNLGDSKAAIKFSDKEEGKIISRLSRTCAFQNGGTTIDLSVTYNMTLIAKDTKYKLTLDPVEWNYNGASYVYPNHVEDMNKCTDKLQKDLAAGIDKASSEKDF